jgi:hypothetical protein
MRIEENTENDDEVNFIRNIFKNTRQSEINFINEIKEIDETLKQAGILIDLGTIEAFYLHENRDRLRTLFGFAMWKNNEQLKTIINKLQQK